MAESKAKSKTSSSKKTEKKKQDNKPVIISICAAIVAVVVIIVVAVVLGNKGLDDSYFVSDGSKKVLTIDTSNEESEDAENYAPVKIHVVYTYSGEDITGAKSYYEYPDADKAKAAFDYMKESLGDDEEVNKYELNGKYIIYTSPEDSYKDLKASDIDKQIELMESATNSSDGAEVEESEEVKVEETEE